MFLLRNPYHGPRGHFVPPAGDAGQAGRVYALRRIDRLPDGPTAGTKQSPFECDETGASLFAKSDPMTQTIADVPVSSLVATRPTIQLDLAKGYVDRTPAQFTDGQVPMEDSVPGRSPIPIVVEHEGRHYLADGHHRATAAWARGAKTVRALKRTTARMMSFRDRIVLMVGQSYEDAIELAISRGAFNLERDEDEAHRKAWDTRGRKGDDHGAVNPSGSDSYSRHTLPDGKFSAHRKVIHDAIVDRYLAKGQKSDRPTAVILGGGPAAGKSTMVKSIAHTLPPNSVHLDVDEIRTHLPEYGEMQKRGDKNAANFTHEEASAITKRIGKEAAEKGFNVTLDGTGDSSIDNLTGKVALYRSRGQAVEGHYVTVDTETAVARANQRGLETGRFVPESVIRQTHRDVSRVFPQAVRRGLYDKFTLWDTNGPKPVLVASGAGKKMTVHDKDAYQRFLAKGRE